MDKIPLLPSLEDFESLTRTIFEKATGPAMAVIEKRLSALVSEFYRLDHERENCIYLAQTIIDITWEKLNTGHWKDVEIQWRHTYTVASIFLALLHLKVSSPGFPTKDDLSEVITVCDMGLLMGAPVMDNFLSTVAKYAQSLLQSFEKNSPNPKRMKLAKGQEDGVNKRSQRGTLRDIKLHNEIARLDVPSLDRFRSDYMEKEKPLIITNGMSHWPCISEHKWSLRYLKDKAGYRTVPIEIGSKYSDDSWSQKLMTVSEFIEKYFSDDADKKGYLAQHQLFEQIPELKADILEPDYCCLGNEEDVDVNAWFGPKGTVSPLHHDPKHNLLCQVVGRKYIKMFSADQSANLYPHEGKILFNTSQIDVESPDFEKFPLFAKTVCDDCILNEGEMLYIPPRYWHYVRSLDVSFSVSFWWQ